MRTNLARNVGVVLDSEVALWEADALVVTKLEEFLARGHEKPKATLESIDFTHSSKESSPVVDLNESNQRVLRFVVVVPARLIVRPCFNSLTQPRQARVRPQTRGRGREGGRDLTEQSHAITPKKNTNQPDSPRAGRSERAHPTTRKSADRTFRQRRTGK